MGVDSTEISFHLLDMKLAGNLKVRMEDVEWNAEWLLE
jgi:hypothetical protein